MNSKTSTPSKDDLQAELLELVDELGHVPTVREMQSLESHSESPYIQEWGTWNAALEAAGLEVNRHTIQSDEECLQELRRVANELGHTPSRHEFDRVSPYSPDILQKRYLGWVHACLEAELDISDISAPPRSHLVDVLQILAVELDREPTPGDMDEYGPYPPSLYERAFDSWGQAVFYAGVHEESGIFDDDLHTEGDSARGETA